MRYLFVLILFLFVALASAENIAYEHDGVLVCYPEERAKEPAKDYEAIKYEREWRKYKFDNELDAKVKIEAMKIADNKEEKQNDRMDSITN